MLIRVSISLIVEVHGVNGVGEGAAIWVDPILFVSVADSFLSPKVLKLCNSALRDQAFLQFVARAFSEKSLKNIRKMYRTSVPAIQNFVLIYFLF